MCGHDFAVGACRRLLLQVLDGAAGRRAVAVINSDKVGLSDREHTYRQMLLDLLALAESTYSGEVEITGVDLVIATRRDEQGRITTTRADIEENVLTGLAAAAEVGLASRGLVNLVAASGVRTHLVQASSNWGTVVADYTANLVYNGRHSDEARLLADLQADGKLRVFRSFGGFMERRARIAERDGDLVGAIFRWSVADCGPAALRQEQADSLRRLFGRLVSAKGTSAPRAGVETLIEMLERSDDLAPAVRYTALGRMESALEEVGGEPARPLQFRLRNYMLLTANHLADCSEASRLIKAQDRMVGRLGSDPEQFHRVLEYQAGKVGASVNRLAFEEALGLARAYEAVVETYRTVWELLQSDQGLSGDDGFERSRLWLRAKGTVIWTAILNLGLNDGEMASELIDTSTSLARRCSHPKDRERFLAYVTQALLRVGRYGEVLQAKEEGQDGSGVFSLFWKVRAVNDGLLAGCIQPGSFTAGVLQVLRQQPAAVRGESTCHPEELLLRELGLLNSLQDGDRRHSVRHLQASLGWLGSQRRSPISAWQSQLGRMHLDFVQGSLKQWSEYDRPEEPGLDGGRLLLSRAAEHCTSSGSPSERLLAVRRVSPY